METINNKVLLGLGTVVAAVGASLCCIVPVAVVLLGVGSAALGAQLEPIRPFFLGPGPMATLPWCIPPLRSGGSGHDL